MVEVPAPLLGHHPSHHESGTLCIVQKVIEETSIVTFMETILPGTARLNICRLDSQFFEPVPQFPGDEP